MELDGGQHALHPPLTLSPKGRGDINFDDPPLLVPPRKGRGEII